MGNSQEKTMVKIIFGGVTYTPTTPSETILDLLLSHKVPHPFSCKGGVCHTCMMKSDQGKVTALSQQGLKETEISAGYFLPCVCVPTEDLTLSPLEIPPKKIPVVLVHKEFLNAQVVRLDFQPLQEFFCHPGQYVNLYLTPDLSRCYSIANLPQEDGYIECHIKLYPNGKISSWAHTQAREGDRVEISSPLGTCFYTNINQENFPILLAGTGTGIAPLRGILLDALAQKHSGEITLIQGAKSRKDLYYVSEFDKVSYKHSSFNYRISLQEEGGNLEKELEAALKEPSQTRAYVCGSPPLVEKLKKTLFLAGVPSSQILSDSFISHSLPFEVSR